MYFAKPCFLSLQLFYMEKNSKKLQVQMHSPNYFFSFHQEKPKPYSSKAISQPAGCAGSQDCFSVCVTRALVSSTAKSFFAAVIVSALSETGKEQTQAPSLLM